MSWRTSRRLAAIALAGVIGVSLFLARPWSSRNSFRQMRMFAPGARIENFRTMD